MGTRNRKPGRLDGREGAMVKEQHLPQEKPNVPAKRSISRRTVLGGLAAVTAGAAVPAVDRSPAFASHRKFHPGHYFRPSQPRWSAERQAADFATLDTVAANPNITGIMLGLHWYHFERAPGDYSPGFRIVDAYLDKLNSLPTEKYLMVRVLERSFGGTENVYPPYLVRDGLVITPGPGEQWSGNLASAAKMWQPDVMDRLIALSRAFATRYNSHPRFETFSLAETALGVPPDSGNTVEARLPQLKRWFTESKKVWTNTFLRLTANYLGGEGTMRDLITHCVNTVTPGGVVVGGPDPELPLPDITRTIAANRVFRGLDQGEDLRGKVPWIGEVQAMGLGTRFTEPPSDIFDYYYNVMRANYMVWMQNTFVGGPEQRWQTGILPFIDSINGRIRTHRPSIGS